MVGAEVTSPNSESSPRTSPAPPNSDGTSAGGRLETWPEGSDRWPSASGPWAPSLGSSTGPSASPDVLTPAEEADVLAAWREYSAGGLSVVPRGLPEWAFRLYVLGVPPGAIGFVAERPEAPAPPVYEERIARLEAGHETMRSTVRLLLTAVDNLSKRPRQ